MSISHHKFLVNQKLIIMKLRNIQLFPWGMALFDFTNKYTETYKIQGDRYIEFPGSCETKLSTKCKYWRRSRTSAGTTGPYVFRWYNTGCDTCKYIKRKVHTSSVSNWYGDRIGPARSIKPVGIVTPLGVMDIIKIDSNGFFLHDGSKHYVNPYWLVANSILSDNLFWAYHWTCS